MRNAIVILVAACLFCGTWPVFAYRIPDGIPRDLWYTEMKAAENMEVVYEVLPKPKIKCTNEAVYEERRVKTKQRGGCPNGKCYRPLVAAAKAPAVAAKRAVSVAVKRTKCCRQRVKCCRKRLFKRLRCR